MSEQTSGRSPMLLGVYLIDGAGRRPGWRLPAHVLGTLRALRPRLAQLVVGVTGPLTRDDVEAVAELADSVVVGGREVTHGRLVAAVGQVGDYDSVILTGSAWFGPVADLGPVLERMAAVDEWSLVPKGDGRPHEPGSTVRPDTSWYVMPGHVADSPELAGWRAGGDLRRDASGVSYAFDPVAYPSIDPVLMNLPSLIDDGLPFVPLSSLGVDPLLADRLAVVPGDALERLRDKRVDLADLWAALLDRYPLRVLSTNLGLTRVVTGHAPGDDPALRTVAILHLFYDDLTDDLMDRVDLLPGEVTVVITTAEEGRRVLIEERLAARTRLYDHEVRVVPSNRGRDISAFLVGCADVLRDESYDLVVKLHGKRSVQDDVNASAWFRRHLLDNLLGSGDAARELYGWFASEPSLGVVVPPVIHMHYPTMGHGWMGNRPIAEGLAERLGLTVPLDPDTPVAPYGSMFVARRATLAPWLGLGLTWDDFPETADYADGTLAHAIERMFCYVAAGTGRYTVTALGAGVGGIEYGFLEYKLQAVGAHLPVYAIDQVPLLTRHPAVRIRAWARRVPGVARLYRALRRR